MTDKEESLFERLQQGLQESIAHSRGELSLVTVELPAPPPKAQPKQIASLRRKFRMSQAVFAATLNVSPKTVQSWEQGLRQPGDAALRMLQVLSAEPQVVLTIFRAGKRNCRSRYSAARSAACQTRARASR